MKRLAMAVLLLTILVMAYGGTGYVHAQDDEELTPIRLITLPFISHAPLYIAQEMGFFEEEGLAVEILEIRSGEEANIALVQGEADVAATGLSPAIINAVGRGGEIRIVADKGSIFADDTCNYISLVINPELVESGEVETVADLVGHPLALNPTSAMALLLEDELEAYDLTLDDLTIEVMAPNVTLDAMNSGAMQGTVTTDPWITRTIDAGAGVELLGYAELTDSYTYAFIAFGASMLEADPNVQDGFMRAYLRGVAQYNEGPTEENIAIYEAAFGLEPELLQRLCYPTIAADGMINPDTLERYQAWALEKGYIDAILEVDQLWDPSFLERIAAETE